MIGSLRVSRDGGRTFGRFIKPLNSLYDPTDDQFVLNRLVDRSSPPAALVS
jgi:hypothetical protein